MVAGGVIGCALRYVVTRNPSDIPREVLALNLVGAAGAGWIVGRIRLHSHPARWLIPFAAVGAAGALTGLSTYSTWTVETVSLWREGSGGRIPAAVNYLGLFAVGLGLAWIGWTVGGSLG